jgi:hypothetical protein
MYTYHEGEGTRGQNYVASILLDYLTSNLTADKSEFWLFSDGRPGQGKNHVYLGPYIKNCESRHTCLSSKGTFIFNRRWRLLA